MKLPGAAAMKAFLKKHWKALVLVLLLIFLWGVFKQVLGTTSLLANLIFKAAPVLLMLLSLLLSGPVLLIPLVLGLWGSGFIWGFLPNSLYDWIPRSTSQFGVTR